MGQLLLGKKVLSQDLLEEIETLLLTADVGVSTTHKVIEELQQGLARNQLTEGSLVFQAIQTQLEAIVSPCALPLEVTAEPSQKPFVILVVGVNGAGKTTTIGKLAKQFQAQGKKVLLAAGDTFRAAAIEQLQIWGERNEVAVIAQKSGADSASVIYDAMQAAKARGIDIVLADTAGRLHTQKHLMEELRKVKRVMQKLDATAPQEILLVLDACIGQNALQQAKEFHQALGVTGIVMTKLDGTAKGGILFAIANELQIPFRYIGTGEKIEDLDLFDATSFVAALFSHD
jgi:fused signal recognition particle receptor